MDQVKREARRRKVQLLIIPTDEAIEALAQDPDDTNAILHVTCRSHHNRRNAFESEHFGHEIIAAILRLFVAVSFLPIGKLHPLPLKLFIGNEAQQM
jgi:hypothetical protein